MRLKSAGSFLENTVYLNIIIRVPDIFKITQNAGL